MPPPDVSLIFVVTAASLAAYLLWILDAAPRVRRLLVALTVVAVIAAVIAHEVEMANIVAADIAAEGSS
ncbi:MAG TPA: hypothetical protein VKU61_15860 [Candidatus Binatia bacterium]|nr:hypothetical protein [Candidatus Binatia bacterium]